MLMGVFWMVELYFSAVTVISARPVSSEAAVAARAFPPPTESASPAHAKAPAARSVIRECAAYRARGRRFNFMCASPSLCDEFKATPSLPESSGYWQTPPARGARRQLIGGL